MVTQDELEPFAIVVPCFDEAARLQPEAFEDFAERHPSCRFVFVDDGSSDDTRVQLEALVARRPEQLSCIGLEVRCGKAEAVRAGVLAALAAHPAAVGYWDADLSTPLDAIPDFLECLAARPEVSIVMGSRVKLLGRDISRQSWRHYLGRSFATAVSLGLRLPVYDTQCGAKLLRVSPETRALFEEPWHSRWIFDVELLARFVGMRRAEGRDVEPGLYELPLRHWHHVHGSKIRPRDFFTAPRELLHILRRLREVEPRQPGDRSQE